MIYLISILFVLSVLIFFHELGHFIAAKLFGVRVERFSIGFPPRLFGVQVGDTDYCVSAIPFGGYVKLSGMIDESLDASTLKGEPYEFMSRPLVQKVVIISAGVVMNFVLAVVIMTGILWHDGEQILPTTTIGRVIGGGIAEKIGFQPYDRIVAINGQPVQSWNDVMSRYITSFDREIDFTIQRHGRLMHLLLDKEKLGEENIEQLNVVPLFPARVGDLTPDFPAQRAGLQKGDWIIAIGEMPVPDWEAMTKIVRANPARPLLFTIVRNSETLKVVLTPKATIEKDEQGNELRVGKIGIGPYFEFRPISFLQSCVRGLERTIFIARLNIKGFGWLITGKKSPREILGGPIMITKLAGDFAKTGFMNLLMLVANLSIILAMVNILPIPALDGGHLAIIMIEGVRKKPFSVKTKMAIQQVGMALILLLMLFVIYNDLNRLIFK